MLKLVVDNTQHKKPEVTCRNSCELFDEITNQCAIKDDINVDDALEVLRCGHFIQKEESNWYSAYKTNSRNGANTRKFSFSLIEDECDFRFEDEDLFHEFLGEKFKKDDSVYPLQPDFQAKRNDASWYVSPNQDFGCWIINKSQNKWITVPKSGEAEEGWGSRVYKSPIPLHDHKASLSLASKMAWYVDEEGYGQYVLLLNGQISQISNPKPKNWK